ncbi:uncharacterized protein F5891DRAFT_317404 [Suillus fuscotomentosus]|uniref:Uncharacterized protein n=1 Tax=Suillus fuscotomentosus TaxID=1912939 RepID=A0AAD4DNG4_9AGAM|nr:uncharacterized protein F5891DRAFT_317404 [Suillus fuscotomentosus]KAG1886369.1 hypothetical protein F5891DRAFT_317404 [Suillus fuscotomentosus]
MDRRTMLKRSKSKVRVGSCMVWDLGMFLLAPSYACILIIVRSTGINHATIFCVLQVTCPIYRHFLVERKFHCRLQYLYARLILHRCESRDTTYYAEKKFLPCRPAKPRTVVSGRGRD